MKRNLGQSLTKRKRVLSKRVKLALKERESFDTGESTKEESPSGKEKKK